MVELYLLVARALKSEKLKIYLIETLLEQREVETPMIGMNNGLINYKKCSVNFWTSLVGRP